VRCACTDAIASETIGTTATDAQAAKAQPRAGVINSRRRRRQFQLKVHGERHATTIAGTTLRRWQYADVVNVNR
jgi:hypothetical protein|tara:strand:- start:455 stop:676 length:222 start_codon:yes stop_codon:yes gene_type:complete